MPERIDFTRNVAVYDRRHGAFLQPEAARELARLASLGRDSRVLDVGAGTGRVAVPLVHGGCHVFGLDLSHSMLASIPDKASDVRVPSIVGDATQLPVQNGVCDAIVIARLLYLVPEWQGLLDEARRALKPGGCLLHEWGNGGNSEAWVQIREHARILFEAAGIANPFHPGARKEGDVDAYLVGQGFALNGVAEFDADVRMTLREFLDRIGNGECSYTWKLPADIQQRCIPALVDWATTRFDLTHIVASSIVWKVYQKMDAPS